MKVNPGDWVRFEHNGHVVVGVVLYRQERPGSYPYEPEAITDLGRVAESKILERRVAPDAREGDQ